MLERLVEEKVVTKRWMVGIASAGSWTSLSTFWELVKRQGCRCWICRAAKSGTDQGLANTYERTSNLLLVVQAAVRIQAAAGCNGAPPTRATLNASVAGKPCKTCVSRLLGPVSMLAFTGNRRPALSSLLH